MYVGDAVWFICLSCCIQVSVPVRDNSGLLVLGIDNRICEYALSIASTTAGISPLLFEDVSLLKERCCFWSNEAAGGQAKGSRRLAPK